jgi:hypothetical protein
LDRNVYPASRFTSDGTLFLYYETYLLLARKYNNGWYYFSAQNTPNVVRVNSFDITLDATEIDGSILVLSSDKHNGSGLVNIYKYHTTNYVFSNGISITCPDSSDLEFGGSTRITRDGSRIFITGRKNVYIYRRCSEIFEAGSWILESTITIRANTTDYNNVSISRDDGLTFAIHGVVAGPVNYEADVIRIYKFINGNWYLYDTTTSSYYSPKVSVYNNGSYMFIQPNILYKDNGSSYVQINGLNNRNYISSDGKYFINVDEIDDYYLGNISLITKTNQKPISITGNIFTDMTIDSVYVDEGVVLRNDYSLDSTVSTVNNTQYGFYTVTYTASENSNIATATRRVSVNPRVQFNNLNYFVERFGSYVEQGITITDGDGYELTIDTSNINDSVINNVYPFDIVYTLTNDTTGHSASYIREITVADTTLPVGELNNPSSLTLERYGVYSDPVPGVINLDQGSYIYETDLSNVDNTLPYGSTFDVVYNLRDNFNSNSIIRTVTIVDTT